jgi:hypothetical protein
MPVLLLGMGVFAVVAGLVMIGFGIPINEFSFGNTLISAGTTAAVGGLIIIAVGIAVGQLRRIAATLADPIHASMNASMQGAGQSQSPGRFPLPPDEPEILPVARRAQPGPQGVQGGQGGAHGTNGSRAPSPPRQKERPASDPFAMEPEADEHPDQSFAPSLRNPDEAPLPVDDDVSLSPRHPQGAPAPAAMSPNAMSPSALDRTSDSFDWRVPPPAANAPPAPMRPQPANFDAMWPAEGKAGKAPSPAGAPAAAAKPRIEARVEPQMPKEAVNIGAKDAVKDAAKDAAKPRGVAILKSGVVDGMGYTLYVDGSIEAELPQGTLRFASINELRSHLEKNS